MRGTGLAALLSVPHHGLVLLARHELVVVDVRAREVEAVDVLGFVAVDRAVPVLVGGLDRKSVV